MTDSSTAPARPFDRLLLRVVLGPLEVASRLLELLLVRRALGLWFLAAMAVPVLAGWLRPPLSRDIRGVHLPLMSSGAQGPSAEALLYGPREFTLISPGSVMLGLIAVGAVIVLAKPHRLRTVAGALLCAAVGCVAAVVFNHPELVDLLDGQNEQRQQLTSVLEATAHPPINVVSFPRVEAPPASGQLGGGLMHGLRYLRHAELLFLLPSVALLLSTRGPLRRRLGSLALWCLAGLVLAGGLCFGRLRAEWCWQRAVAAERAGDPAAARFLAEAAVERFGEFDRLPRTWVLLGGLDYRQGRASPASDYFQAYQSAANGDFRRAVAKMDGLTRDGVPTPAIRRWTADLYGQQAFALFNQGRRQAAADSWRRAIEVDPGQVFRGLFIAPIRSRALRGSPDVLAAGVDPLLDQLADRPLRAALLAMLGDDFFEAGRFAEARSRYIASLRAYSLPKQINHRAQRGLYGM